MDGMTIVDPWANTKAVFQTNGQQKSLSADMTDNPHGRLLRNLN